MKLKINIHISNAMANAMLVELASENFQISSQKLLKLLNKAKISISSDETRHYLNGIYFHKTKIQNQSFLTGVATDSHRLSSSCLEIDENINFEPIILPKKTVYQLISLLEQATDNIKISNNVTGFLSFQLVHFQLSSNFLQQSACLPH